MQHLRYHADRNFHTKRTDGRDCGLATVICDEWVLRNNVYLRRGGKIIAVDVPPRWGSGIDQTHTGGLRPRLKSIALFEGSIEKKQYFYALGGWMGIRL